MNHRSAAILVALCLGSVTFGAPASKPCVRTSFQTSLVERACQDGQLSAIRAMSSFVSQANDLTGDQASCATCHSAIGKGFPLKPDGLATFESYAAKIRARD